MKGLAFFMKNRNISNTGHFSIHIFCLALVLPKERFHISFSFFII